jgi:hypothetical protein
MAMITLRVKGKSRDALCIFHKLDGFKYINPSLNFKVYDFKLHDKATFSLFLGLLHDYEVALIHLNFLAIQCEDLGQ